MRPEQDFLDPQYTCPNYTPPEYTGPVKATAEETLCHSVAEVRHTFTACHPAARHPFPPPRLQGRARSDHCRAGGGAVVPQARGVGDARYVTRNMVLNAVKEAGGVLQYASVGLFCPAQAYRFAARGAGAQGRPRGTKR